jgi:putative transposase
MKNTYHQHFVHFTWAVSERRQLLGTPYDGPMTAALRVACSAQRCLPLTVVCLPDQIHVLLNVNPDVGLEALVRVIKRQSHLAITKQLPRGSAFAWEPGFVACSVSPRDVDAVERYLRELHERHAHQHVMAALEAEM